MPFCLDGFPGCPSRNKSDAYAHLCVRFRVAISPGEPARSLVVLARACGGGVCVPHHPVTRGGLPTTQSPRIGRNVGGVTNQPNVPAPTEGGEKRGGGGTFSAAETYLFAEERESEPPHQKRPHVSSKFVGPCSWCLGSRRFVHTADPSTLPPTHSPNPLARRHPSNPKIAPCSLVDDRHGSSEQLTHLYFISLLHPTSSHFTHAPSTQHSLPGKP